MRIIFTFFSVLITIITTAQINFERVYSTGNFDYPKAVIQTADTGYLVVGSTVVQGELPNIYLLKVDSIGDFMWAKRIGGNQIERGTDVVELNDKGFIISGYTNSIGNGAYDVYIVRTDSIGNVLWEKTYGGSDWDLAHAIHPTSDGNFLVVGETYSFGSGNGDGYVLKIDGTGDTLWTKTYGDTNNDVFYDVVEISTGEYLYAGKSNSFGNQYNAYVVQTDNLGVEIWENNYGDVKDDYVKGIIQNTNGDLILAGATTLLPDDDLDNWSLKIDVSGNYIQQMILPDWSPSNPIPQNDDYFNTVIEHKNHLFFVGSRSFESYEEGNLFCLKTALNDVTNITSAFQKFASEQFEEFNGIDTCFDRGLIFVGTTEGLGTGGASIYLIKLDSSLTFPNEIGNGNIQYYNDISSVLSLNEVKNNISIYPNPADIEFNITNTNNVDLIIIYDLLGQEILREKISTNQAKISSENLKNGTYMVSFFNSGNQMSIGKVVVQH